MSKNNNSNKIAVPRPQLILDYKIFFGVIPPEDRISLISHISKEHILFELSGLNYHLKPKHSLETNLSLEMQKEKLAYFAQTPKLFQLLSEIASEHTKSEKDYPIIFNRQACLFGMEEIINSDRMNNIENFNMAREEVWDAILKYMLAVNYEITQIRDEVDNDDNSFESLNPKMIPLNEILIATNPLFVCYRGLSLLDYFNKHKDYSNELKEYLTNFYGMDFKQFCSRIFHLYVLDRTKDPKMEFFYYPPEGDEGFLEKLSIRHSNQDTKTLIDIRKYPFINFGKGQYIITDMTFLIEKVYNQFLHDFWFDKIKNVEDENGKLKFTIKVYRSDFGRFFEKYIETILVRCFENYKHSKLLLFDQLKVKTNKGDIEIADIYFRYNKKIIIGEVKGGCIYDKEKYGGDVESLYKNDRNKFFKDFGVDQIIEHIKNMDEYINKLDPGFPKGHTYEVYPCIIINDKAMQTPLMADVFNTRFQELLKDFKIHKVKVHPLSLIHIYDLERLEEILNQDPKQVWNILMYNCRDKRFIPPFWNTLNRNQIKADFTQKIKELFVKLEIPK